MNDLKYDAPMRFGLFHAPHHNVNLDPTLAFARDLMLVEHLDRLGFDEAWIGEHHSGGFETIAAPEVFIAAAAERTKHIRLGLGVKSLPYHHPLIVAETVAQLDHMTRGRVMFGAGPGALISDAHMMGINPDQLRRRMIEAMDAIMPLLRGETVNMKTDWFELVDARLGIGLYSHPMVETAVTIMRSPAGAIAAGKYGTGLLTLGGIDDDAMVRHTENWKIFENEAADHGNVADRSKWRITMFMHLAETREQAAKEVAYGLEPYIDYTHDIVSAGGIMPRGLEDPVAWINEHQLGIIGTPDDAIAEIERVQNSLGGFGALLIFQHDWADWPATLRSHELIAEAVRPHFTGSNRMRRESYDWAAARQELHHKKLEGAVELEKKKYRERGKNKNAAE
ncbi:MAG: LLM class flavin-dependent oxidoreductase [Rhodospirillales bacterium]|nr:LLM class flavin-dependent oxidoreductase [Rhodospirillales bacterium]